MPTWSRWRPTRTTGGWGWGRLRCWRASGGAELWADAAGEAASDAYDATAEAASDAYDATAEAVEDAAVATEEMATEACDAVGEPECRPLLLGEAGVGHLVLLGGEEVRRPVVVLDGTYHHHMTPSKLRKLIRTIRTKEGGDRIHA